MRKKQNFKILSFFFIGLIILSCNYDDGTNNSTTSQTSDNFVLKKMHLKEYSKNTKLFNQINKVKSKKLKPINNTGKIVNSSDDNFTVNTDFATYIENNGKHSYTFKINRENPQYLLENLVLNSNESLGYDAYIVQYDINENEYNQLHAAVNINLSDKVTITNLVDENLITNIFNKEEVVDISTMCLNTTVIAANSCPCAGHTIYDIIANPGICICNQSFTLYPTQTIYSWGECTISTGGGGSGSGTGGTSGGGSGGEDTTENNYDGSDPSIHGNGGVSTAPTLDEDDSNILIETPCESLKKLAEPTNQDIDPSIQILKDTLASGVTNEFGIKFKYDVEVSPAVATNILVTGNSGSAPLTKGWNWRGGMHIHTTAGYGMYSWGDVQSLAECYDYAAPANQPFVTNIMICNILIPTTNPSQNCNIYAIKVDNYTTLTNAINTVLNDPKYGIPPSGDIIKDKEEKIKKIHRVQYDLYKAAGDDNLEESFLRQFASYGISLYKKKSLVNNTSTENWVKLTLDLLTNTITETPCPN